MLRALLAGGIALAAFTRAEGAGWQQFPYNGQPLLTMGDSGTDGIRLRGEAGATLAVKPMSEWVTADTCLTWRWRVDAGPPPTDLGQLGANDRAIALWVGFRAEAERMTLAQRYAYGMVRFLAPFSEPPGFILAYTWGGHAPGTAWTPLPQPFLSNIARQKVLHAAPDRHGQWVTETVRLAADFRAAFATAPPAVMQIAVFADGDNTQSRTDVAVEGIGLHRCAPPSPPHAATPDAAPPPAASPMPAPRRR